MRARPRTGLPVAVLCVILAGCSGPTVDIRGTSGPTAVPVGGASSSRCDDITGDASAGVSTGDAAPDDIVAVAMARDDAYLVVGFAFATGVPVTGELFLTVEAHSRDGLIARQLGIEVRDGDGVAAFVATSPTAEALRLDDAVHVADGEVHAAFPLAYVRDLGDGWSWHAMAGVGAAADDFCPGGAGTTEESVASIIVG